LKHNLQADLHQTHVIFMHLALSNICFKFACANKVEPRHDHNPLRCHMTCIESEFDSMHKSPRSRIYCHWRFYLF